MSAGRVRVPAPWSVMAMVCSLCAVRAPVMLRRVRPSPAMPSFFTARSSESRSPRRRGSSARSTGRSRARALPRQHLGRGQQPRRRTGRSEDRPGHAGTPARSRVTCVVPLPPRGLEPPPPRRHAAIRPAKGPGQMRRLCSSGRCPPTEWFAALGNARQRISRRLAMPEPSQRFADEATKWFDAYGLTQSKVGANGQGHEPRPTRQISTQGAWPARFPVPAAAGSPRSGAPPRTPRVTARASRARI